MDKIDKFYMLDTNAINRLCDDADGFSVAVNGISKGFRYFMTEIQCDEIKKTISSGLEELNSTKVVSVDRAKRALKLMEVSARLKPDFLNKIVTLRHNCWLLNGAFQALPDNELDSADMFFDILNENDFQYYSDAMIALISIVDGCTLVTNDKRLFNKVNKHFPGRAIKYENFISILR